MKGNVASATLIEFFTGFIFLAFIIGFSIVLIMLCVVTFVHLSTPLCVRFKRYLSTQQTVVIDV